MNEPGLPHSTICFDEDALSLTLLRLAPALHNQRKLAITANQWVQSFTMHGLEATYGLALTSNSPNIYRH
jgi:hypothetical protein